LYLFASVKSHKIGQVRTIYKPCHSYSRANPVRPHHIREERKCLSKISFAIEARVFQNKWDEKAPRQPYEDIVRENANFEKYYQVRYIHLYLVLQIFCPR
jgi:hypothetical protein